MHSGMLLSMELPAGMVPAGGHIVNGIKIWYFSKAVRIENCLSVMMIRYNYHMTACNSMIT